MTNALSPNSARRSEPDSTFHEFERAVMSLVHGGCCATPNLSVTGRQPAPPLRQNTPFRRLGRDAWMPVPGAGHGFTDGGRTRQPVARPVR